MRFRMAGEAKKISGPKLADLRINRLYFTQDELGQRIGMSGGRLGTIEQRGGAMLLGNFRRLAEVAKITPEELEAIIGDNGEAAPAGDPLPTWAAQFDTLAEAMDALKRAWVDPNVKKAAKKKGGG